MAKVASISAAGFLAPTYDEILADLQNDFRSIYGSDVILTPDSADGQYLAILAQALYDVNQVALAVYQAYAPTFAQGAGLSATVKINGLRRKVATFSTAVGNVTGVVGTQIDDGVVADQNGNLWDLPPSVVIPGAGFLAVNIVAQQPGNLVAPAGTINKIMTPTRGWQTFASTADALPGQPVESDAMLRGRQAQAAALPANSTNAGLYSELQSLPGVTRVAILENDTGVLDANNLVAHSIWVVVEGGAQADIFKAIGQKKAPGAALNGTTVGDYVDPVTGIDYPAIKFSILAYTNVAVAITVKTLSGWATTVATKIQNAVSAYIQSLPIGSKVMLFRVAAIAQQLGGDADAATFELTAITLNAAAADVVIAFDHSAKTLPAAVAVTPT